MPNPLDQLDIESWASNSKLTNRERASSNLAQMLEDGIPLALMQSVMERLQGPLSECSDPDAALNNLQGFVHAIRSPVTFERIFEQDRDAIKILVRIFSISQYLADQLIREPSWFRLLRRSGGEPVAREVLIDEICAEVETSDDEAELLRILRNFRHRETLRIAYGDFIGRLPIEKLTQQISFLADGLCEAAYRAAWRWGLKRFGVPHRPDQQPARFAILALGKLGGNELNYASDIDLMFLAETEGKTDGERKISNEEFFEKLSQQFTRLIGESTSLGKAYRVDLRLRPFGSSGPIVLSPNEMLKYYDQSGRTWERQAMIKARCIAGDTELGENFLASLRPWVYRRYLSAADISGIRALKRRIEKGARESGQHPRDVKCGRGGIRDIEFVIQFLQLLNGADLPLIQTGNTLTAINGLQQVGCLTPSEQSILEENYRFLRRVEHHLQIVYDHQTHTIPDDPAEQRKLAIRMGFVDGESEPALTKFFSEFNERTELNRRILDHLLHDAFGDDGDISEETDLVLDPEPSAERIESVLRRFRFADSQNAYRRLQELAAEQVPFLSSRRCRHFLAAIAEKLLEEIAKTPDPDATLLNLSRISDSLGGKAVLWELFSYHPASMKMCVRLCAASPYLVGIITGNPGMIDELMDSLMIDDLPSPSEMNEWLDSLCSGAEDVEPMLHSFKNSMHLRIGVRDLLGKEDIADTHRALASVAEACLRIVIQREYDALVRRHGRPMSEDAHGMHSESHFVVLSLGKLGGREPNYHSDLDVVFLFDRDGSTQAASKNDRIEVVTNRFFFNQLAQRITRVINRQTRFGKLFDIDARLRPLGSSGSLALSLDDLRDYFESGRGQFWERHLLCKARVVWGDPSPSQETMQVVHQLIQQVMVTQSHAEAMLGMRSLMEQNATLDNLKRGVGGTVDIEFAVQLLQIHFGKECPKVLEPGTLQAIQTLLELDRISKDRADVLYQGYHFLRRIESGIRLMDLAARHDFPTDPHEQDRLAYLLNLPSGSQLREKCNATRQAVRSEFDRILAEFQSVAPTQDS